jgi:hypothetical protein
MEAKRRALEAIVEKKTETKIHHENRMFLPEVPTVKGEWEN